MPDDRTVWVGYDVGLAYRMRAENPDLSFTTARSFHTLAWPCHGITEPEEIDVWCRRHGHGRVATADVVEKRDKVVFLTFEALLTSKAAV